MERTVASPSLSLAVDSDPEAKSSTTSTSLSLSERIRQEERRVWHRDESSNLDRDLLSWIEILEEIH